MLRNVKLSNPNRFFFPPNSVNVRESQFSMKHCVVLIQREKESRLAQILRRTIQLWKFPTNSLPHQGKQGEFFPLRERERTNKFGIVYEIFNPSFDVLGADCRSRECRTNNLRQCIKEDKQLLIILLCDQFFFFLLNIVTHSL